MAGQGATPQSAHRRGATYSTQAPLMRRNQIHSARFALHDSSTITSPPYTTMDEANKYAIHEAAREGRGK